LKEHLEQIEERMFKHLSRTIRQSCVKG